VDCFASVEGSADWQSAVSRIGNPRRAGFASWFGWIARPAEYHSAIQQNTILRYNIVAADVDRLKLSNRAQLFRMLGGE